MPKVLSNWELDFPIHSSAVEVSIVICAYNKSGYTLNCLSAVCESLKFNLTRAEVILVDDCSSDNTKDLFSTVRGLKYLRNETNLGFLASANRGANSAIGSYVLFLNNDTLPIGNWLDPLVSRAQSNPKIGAVGAKLLNEDGTVQEAGGVIFSDGSGWNYGRGWSATDTRIQYARPVDYCSGAALMVRRDLLQKLKGFDTLFVPAYYEDTDLCFQIRKNGYQVWYEPNSVIIHYEGISHGKDISTGIKAVQEQNRIKFLAKWNNVLATNFPNNSSLVNLAANKYYTTRILMIDHQIPTPDQDSGSLRIFELIRSMVELNCQVTFLAQNGLLKQVYSEQLSNLGVEVIPANQENLQQLKSRKDFYDFIWIARPDPAHFFFNELQSAFADIPIIYDTVDLHFLRFRRGAQIQESTTSHLESLYMEIDELELIERSSKVIVVSDYEKEVLKPLIKKPIFLLPNVHLPIDYIAGPKVRNGLLFIGGFAHQPNEDAIKWFIDEILPNVVEEIPEIKLRVVGSKMPNWLVELKHPNVEVLGWVPDLTPLYSQSRVCIAPLRYGAGVKGKVGEAMSFGVPIVLTDIAAEGLRLIYGQNCLIENEPKDFAQACIELLKNDDLWLNISAKSISHIEENFGKTSTLNRVKQLLGL